MTTTDTGPSAPTPGAGPPSYPGAPARLREDGASSVRQRIVYVLVCTVLGAAVAFPAAWVWVKLADPPGAALTRQGVFFGEAELDRDVGVTMWFLVVGLGFGLLCGLVVGYLGRRHGVATVLAVLGLCAVASVVSFQLGLHLFGPDEDAQLRAANVGDMITSAVSVSTKVAYLGWPVGGLAGAIGAIFGWPRGQKPVWMPPSSSSLSVH